MIPQVNQIYRHFKGNLYRVITIAVHTETEEELVIYQALYGDFKVYARPLSMFVSEVDKEKYPDVIQKMRFEPIEQMVEMTPIPVNLDAVTEGKAKEEHAVAKTGEAAGKKPQAVQKEKISLPLSDANIEENKEQLLPEEDTEEIISLDPLLEAYLDTDSYREKLNILHGLQHRITEHMLNTMAIVIDFELPEGDVQTKYNALNDCLITKERYECNRVGRF